MSNIYSFPAATPPCIPCVWTKKPIPAFSKGKPAKHQTPKAKQKEKEEEEEEEELEEEEEEEEEQRKVRKGKGFKGKKGRNRRTKRKVLWS